MKEDSAGDWVVTWATALVSVPPANPLFNQTVRQIARTSLGGKKIRVVLGSRADTPSVEIGAAGVALRGKGSSIVESTFQPLTFDGKKAAQLKAGSALVSDPVVLPLDGPTEIAVDLYLPGRLEGPSPIAVHNFGLQTSYLSLAGNHTGSVDLPLASQTPEWFFMERIEVLTSEAARAVVTFGDSITDGWGSTTDSNGRWPDHLARRLAARNGHPFAVVNASLSGNQLLVNQFGDSGLSRFERDALSQDGVSHVVVMLGLNDIAFARSSPAPGDAELIAGHQQLITRARARGLKIYGATLTPFEGSENWTEVGERKRTLVNDWIRTSGEYDAVLDFDRVLADPTAPTKLLPKYDSGDHLHPGDAGYKAMGEAIPLELF